MHINNHHSDEIMISDRTLYNYTNNGLFSARNIDMPRTVRMKPRKNKSKVISEFSNPRALEFDLRGNKR